jgi:4-carboxymuconolactone decarboxylase
VCFGHSALPTRPIRANLSVILAHLGMSVYLVGSFIMRLPLIPPTELSPEQRSLYEDMHEGISTSFQGFIAIRKDGTLMGPWNPWLHEARIGKPIWDLTKALSAQSNLPDPARQVAILVTGAHFRAAYEIYAHVAVAEHDKLPDAKLATIVAGQRPPDLTREGRCL